MNTYICILKHIYTTQHVCVPMSRKPSICMKKLETYVLHIDTYIHTDIYIYIIYIEGWSGYLYTYIHVDIYIHAYTYIERFKVLRFDTVAKNEMQTVLYSRSVFLVSTSIIYTYIYILHTFWGL